MSIEIAKVFRRTPDSETAEFNLPPEYCHYRDEGCEFSRSCLNCPFTRCLDEEPGGRKRYLKLKRDREIIRLYECEGKMVREIATTFQVSRRTVQRILKNRRDTPSEEAP